MGRFAAVCVLLVSTACRPSAPPVEPAAEPIARAFYDEVRAGGDIEADPHVAHELKNPTSEEQLAQFRALIPPGEPVAVETRADDVAEDAVGVTTRITQAYRYPGQTVVARTALFRSPSGREPVIVGFEVSLEPAGGG